MHGAIEGCARVYFGMSASSDYLTATVNTAAVRHHSVEAFVNMSQMTVTQMSITESTDSPQHKLHWLWNRLCPGPASRLPTMRPTVFLDGFFRLFARRAYETPTSWRCQWAVATSLISGVDVARVRCIGRP